MRSSVVFLAAVAVALLSGAGAQQHVRLLADEEGECPTPEIFRAETMNPADCHWADDTSCSLECTCPTEHGDSAACTCDMRMRHAHATCTCDMHMHWHMHMHMVKNQDSIM